MKRLSILICVLGLFGITINLPEDARSDALASPPSFTDLFDATNWNLLRLPAFPDLTGHWSAPYLQPLIAAGILAGSGDGLMHPDDPITRAQAVQLFASAGGLLEANATTSSSPFPDVASTDWFAPAVSAAQADDIIQGEPDGMFHPNQAVTRAEFAQMAASAFSMAAPMTSDETGLADVSIDDWYGPAVAALFQNGIVSGEGDGYFHPDQSVSRAEAAVILERVLASPPGDATGRDAAGVEQDVVNYVQQAVASVNSGDSTFKALAPYAGGLEAYDNALWLGAAASSAVGKVTVANVRTSSLFHSLGFDAVLISADFTGIPGQTGTIAASATFFLIRNSVLEGSAQSTIFASTPWTTTQGP